MQPVKLILAKHHNAQMLMPVRGVLFAEQCFKQLVEESDGRTLRAVVEERYDGDPRYYAIEGIHHNPILLHLLQEETQACYDMLREVAKALERGRELRHVPGQAGMGMAADAFRQIGSNIAAGMDSLPDWLTIPFQGTIAQANRKAPGSVLLLFSDTDQEAQLKSIEANRKRRMGYVRAYSGGADGADMLFESLADTANAVLHSDLLLQRQLELLQLEHPKEGIIVRLGSNHRHIAKKLEAAGMETELFIQPNEPFPYYDEALRLKLEEDAPELRLRQLIEADLKFNFLLTQQLRALRQAGHVDHGTYVEDIMHQCRGQVEQELETRRSAVLTDSGQ